LVSLKVKRRAIGKAKKLGMREVEKLAMAKVIVLVILLAIIGAMRRVILLDMTEVTVKAR
jgi:hypothetical protein